MSSPAALKYVMVREESSGIEFPVFACAPVTHEAMATAWRRNDSRRVVSAGFCQLTATHAITYGYSMSLRMGPRDEDARLIAVFTRVTCRLDSNDHQGAANAHAFPQ